MSNVSPHSGNTIRDVPLHAGHTHVYTCNTGLFTIEAKDVFLAIVDLHGMHSRQTVETHKSQG